MPKRIVELDVSWIVPADLEAVDALARLQLVALRRGVRVCLCRPSEDLVDLLRLTGLTEALPASVRRESEPTVVADPRDCT